VVGLTIFCADESEARGVDADGEAVGKVVEGCIGGRLEGTGVEDTLPFAPTVVQTLLLLGGGGEVATS
jgi:hypothetical protein